MENFNDFINKITNKKIMFCGIGKSNLPLIKMLADKKISVIAYDFKNSEKISQNILESISGNKYITLRLGDESVWEENIDIIIKTPGISFYSENIKKAREKGTIVTSEMEMFFELCPCTIIGITGSDGKTTVSTIIAEILKADGKKVHLGGNIGKPLLPEINSIKKDDFAVVELSSFQLLSMRKSPDIAVITNISPNHLDVHKNMDEYIFAKKQILLHQSAFSKAVLNFDNDETKKLIADVRGQCLYFSRKEKLNNGVWVDENKNIVYSLNEKCEKIINISDIKIPGNHNVENYLAAITATKDLVKIESIKAVAQSFSGVNHRIEFVRNVNGVRYYNDSIASSPTRVIKGTLSLFDKKIILIAGGYDKKTPFDELGKKIIEKVSILILMGNAAQKIENSVINLPGFKSTDLKIIHVKNMEDAVKEAQKNSTSGDIVVLSPACASFDLYNNFEERGNHFKTLVNNL